MEGVMIGRGVDGLVAARRASMSTIWWTGVDGVIDIVIVVGDWVGELVIGEMGVERMLWLLKR